MEEEKYIRNDELKIYRGKDFIVSKHIIIHQVTLDEICDYGEEEYFSLLNSMTATPQSMKVQLWDMGIDYTEIKPYELFYGFLHKTFSPDKTKILFGDLDFTKFQPLKKEDDTIMLYQETLSGEIYDMSDNLLYEFSNLKDASRYVECSPDELYKSLEQSLIFKNYVFKNLKIEPIIIDEYTYNMIIDYLCKSHFIKQDLQIPMNNTTKLILIDDERMELEARKNKEYHSRLKNLISTLINSDGFKCNHSQVWDMKINAFMDSVKRFGKIKNADLLLQSGYSGFGVNLKEISKEKLDWFGELT